MKLPEPLCDIFLDNINLAYMHYKEGYKGSHYLQNIKPYLSFAESHMADFFCIEWSNGGTYGSCYDDELDEVYRDDEPDMTALKNFLNKSFPQLVDFQKQEIFNLVSFSNRYSNDYYGGSIEYLQKKLSFQILGKYLCRFYPEIDESSYQDLNQLIKEYGYPDYNVFSKKII